MAQVGWSCFVAVAVALVVVVVVVIILWLPDIIYLRMMSGNCLSSIEKVKN